MKDDIVKDSLSAPTIATRNKKLKTINPATEAVLKEYQIISKEQIDDKVKKAQNAFQDWKKDASKRTDLLHDFANELRKDKENLAKTATNEMGKAIKEARSEVEKCAWAMEYYADNGKIFLTDEVVNTDARKTVIKFQPIGVIGSIMPWNFPYWQAGSFKKGNSCWKRSYGTCSFCSLCVMFKDW
jgi:acyl-CoA reductase-like NAD-dependent aldehyde dehydrogenase